MTDDSDFIDRPFTDFSNRQLRALIMDHSSGPGSLFDDLENILNTTAPDLYDKIIAFEIDLARVYNKMDAPLSAETGLPLESMPLMEQVPIQDRFSPVTKDRLAGILHAIVHDGRVQALPDHDILYTKIRELRSDFAIPEGPSNSMGK